MHSSVLFFNKASSPTTSFHEPKATIIVATEPTTTTTTTTTTSVHSCFLLSSTTWLAKIITQMHLLALCEFVVYIYISSFQWAMYSILPRKIIKYATSSRSPTPK
jgi:hypothetical protein